LQRGEPPTVDYTGVNTSVTVYFDAADVHSILIVCGNFINYKNIKTQTMWQTVLYLLSVYYAFDRNYPALYGILLVIERYCLCAIGGAKGGQKSDKLTWKNFIRDFHLFLKNEK
jgi:hypothetical protein